MAEMYRATQPWAADEYAALHPSGPSEWEVEDFSTDPPLNYTVRMVDGAFICGTHGATDCPHVRAARVAEAQKRD